MKGLIKMFEIDETKKIITPANKSISSISKINKGKKEKILSYFSEMKKIKNEVSKTIHKNHLIDIYNSNLEFEKNLYKSINSELIGSWELQTTTKEIIEHKKEQIKRFVFKYSPKLLVIENNKQFKTTYKKNTKTQKAISETLKYFYFLRNNLKIYKKNKDKKLFQKMLKNKKNLDKIKLQFSEYKWNKILKITKMIISNLDKKLKLGNYETGSHYKNGQVTKSPLLLIDESNNKYKMFYQLKTLSGNINIPITYNEKYHQKFKFFLESSPVKGKKRIKKDIIKVKESSSKESLIQRQHMISLSKRTNRLLIGLSYQKELKMLKKGKTIGIDVGSKTNNHLATPFGLYSFNFDNKISNKVQNLDKQHETFGDNSKFRFDLKKLFREVLDLRLKSIKSFLLELKNLGYTDVVMENIGQFNKTRGKNHDNNLKVSRYRDQLINLGGLEKEFRTIAHNLGMRIHSIPAYYTSKYCHNCNSIHDNNRNGEKFVCINCGSSGNADIHAALNISYIFERFSKILCNFSSFDEFLANKYLTKDKVKEIITQ